MVSGCFPALFSGQQSAHRRPQQQDKAFSDPRSADARQRPDAAGLQASHVAAGAPRRSPHGRDPRASGQNHGRRSSGRERRRGAAGPQHHWQHPTLQTARSHQEPPHQLPVGGGGRNQPAAGNQQADVQGRSPEGARKEEEERQVWEEAGRREEEEEGQVIVMETRGRSRQRNPPGVEVVARPAEGAAVKHRQTLTKNLHRLGVTPKCSCYSRL